MVAHEVRQYGPTAYSKCFQNVTLKERRFYAFDTDAKTWDRIMYYYQGILGIPFTLVALIGAVLYILAVRKAMQEHTVSRKFFSLLINRGFGDFVACVSSLILSYYSIWLVYVFIMVYTLSVVSLTTVPSLRAWSGCTSEKCLHPMYQGRNALVIIVYLFTIGCFVMTLLLIRRAKRSSERFHKDSSHHKQSVTLKRRFRYPMLKLAMHVSTFAIFHLPYAIWAAVITFSDGCFYPKHYNTMEMFKSLVRISILCRIVADCLLSLFMEAEIRRSLISLFPCSSRISPMSQPPRRLETIKSGATLSSSDYSATDTTTAPLSEAEKQKQRSVSERGLLKQQSIDLTPASSLRQPGKVARAETIEVIPEAAVARI